MQFTQLILINEMLTFHGSRPFRTGYLCWPVSDTFLEQTHRLSANWLTWLRQVHWPFITFHYRNLWKCTSHATGTFCNKVSPKKLICPSNGRAWIKTSLCASNRNSAGRPRWNEDQRPLSAHQCRENTQTARQNTPAPTIPIRLKTRFLWELWRLVLSESRSSE